MCRCNLLIADTGEAAASAAATTADATATPEDSFCQLFGANLRRESQCLDDWRLQLLELLPAAQLQLTQAQASSRHVFPKTQPCRAKLVVYIATALWSKLQRSISKDPFLHLCHFHIAHLSLPVTPQCMRLDVCAVTFHAQAAFVVLA